MHLDEKEAFQKKGNEYQLLDQFLLILFYYLMLPWILCIKKIYQT